MNPHSLRLRLQLWHGLLLVLVLGAFATLMYRMAWTDELARVDRELESRVGGLFRPPRPMEGPPPGFPRPEDGRQRMMEAIGQAGPDGEVYFLLFGPGGDVLARSANAPVAVAAPDVGGPSPGMVTQGRTRAGFREVYRPLPFGEVLLVGRPLEPEIAALRKLGLTLGLAACGLLALGLAGGHWLVSRAIRPIGAIGATAARIAAGDLTQRIPVEQPLSELGQLSAALNRTFAELEAAFQRQARFTADASHELRTPVTIMLSQIQTALARERPAAEYRETLLACQRAAQRMRRLTESLLALTRVESGQESARREPVDLGRVAEETLELMRGRADERGVRLVGDLAKVECTGDADGLAQVMTNLLANAIHFTPAGGEVRLSVARNGAGVRFAVHDTGPGIPPDALPHVFERFYRADPSRQAASGGAGLGLAICEAIVKAHGGTITAASRPGDGALFTVALPDRA